MNKKEAISLGLFLVSFFLIGFMLFSGINKDIKITLQNGKTVASQVSPNFSVTSTIFLMVFSALAGGSLLYYLTDVSKKISLSRSQHTSLKMLDGDVRKVYQFILEKDEILQKDLVYELGMSKAKVTRVLDKLVEKNLIKSISYGKTNKIVAE